MKATRQAMMDVWTERLSQDNKWGEQNHSPERWLAILGEEFGEVAKEIAEGLPDVEAYEAELIQTAAVAAAALECSRRHR